MPSSFHYSLVVLVSVIIAVASELLAYTLYSPSLTSTWYRRWWKTAADDGPYKVPCFDSIRYEPYVLVPRGGETPAFDEEFVGCAALSCPPARSLVRSRARSRR